MDDGRLSWRPVSETVHDCAKIKYEEIESMLILEDGL